MIAREQMYINTGKQAFMKEYRSHLPVEKETMRAMNDAGKAVKDARISRRKDNIIRAF